MSRKYLEDIIPKEEIFGYHDASDERHKRWCEQEEVYGFNDIETWDFDATFAQLIYERLMMYKEVADSIVDLSSKTVDIWDTNLNKYITRTLDQCVDLMIEKCKLAIKTDTLPEYNEYMDEVWAIIKQTHWDLWW